MRLAIIYLIVSETLTVSIHFEVSRCVEKNLLFYILLSGLLCCLIILSLILLFMYLIKHYTLIFVERTITLKDLDQQEV